MCAPDQPREEITMTNTTAARTTQLVDEVKAYATEHYNEGWDVVVETMSDEDIAEKIGRSQKLTTALGKFSTLVSVHSERVADAVISAGEAESLSAALKSPELKAQAEKSAAKSSKRKSSKLGESIVTAITTPKASAPKSSKAKSSKPAAKSEQPKTTTNPGAYVRHERKSRATGTVFQVLDLSAKGADVEIPESGESWAVRDVEHGTIHFVKTHRAAVYATWTPQDFCRKCATVVRKREKSAESK